MNDVVTAPKAHQFQPGKSGNPAGRPKGSRNAISIIKLQIEGELRAQMRPQMQAIVAEMLRQALPQPVFKDGKPVVDALGVAVVTPGDRDMLKTLFNSWVSKTKAGDEEAPKEKIVIQIGKLDQIPTVSGRTITNGEE
jgi:hypothetical protein